MKGNGTSWMENAVFWDVLPVALVITGVSEECIASTIRVEKSAS
jgi:hypothetical protein